MKATPLSQPVTASLLRWVLIIACAIGLLAVGGWWGWQKLQASETWKKFSLRHYLKKEAGRRSLEVPFDFNIQQTVSNRQAAITQFRTNLWLMETNLAQLALDLTGRRKESLTLREETRSLRVAVTALESDLAEKERRLTNRLTELRLAQTNVLTRETNVLDLSRQAATATEEAQRLTNAPNQKLARMAALKREELATRENGLKTSRMAQALAETNVFNLQTNLAALRTTAREKRLAWLEKQKAEAACQTRLAEQQKELTRLRAEYEARRIRELPAKVRELNLKEQEAASQTLFFLREVRKKIAEAPTYGAIYLQIGQVLWVADRLLEQPDPAKQRAGLALAAEACRHANDSAENSWVASLIAEIYLLPNLSRADPPDKPHLNAEQYLLTTSQTFQRAEATNQLIRNYQLQVEYATDPRRADSARYSLSFVYEQQKAFSDAIHQLKLISDTNLLRYSTQRLVVLEQRRKTGR
jgi:hypothetical protein